MVAFRLRLAASVGIAFALAVACSNNSSSPSGLQVNRQEAAPDAGSFTAALPAGAPGLPTCPQGYGVICSYRCCVDGTTCADGGADAGCLVAAADTLCDAGAVRCDGGASACCPSGSTCTTSGCEETGAINPECPESAPNSCADGGCCPTGTTCTPQGCAQTGTAATCTSGPAYDGGVASSLIGFSVVGAITDTGQDGYCHLYVSDNGPSGALVNDGASTMSVALSLGFNTFYLFEGHPQTDLPAQPLSIFFDGNESSPAISVSAALQTSASTLPTFSAFSGAAWALEGGNISGAGTLSFVDPISGLRVTLVGFQDQSSSLDTLHRVGSNCISATANGNNNTVFVVTLYVEAAQVPCGDGTCCPGGTSCDSGACIKDALTPIAAPCPGSQVSVPSDPSSSQGWDCCPAPTSGQMVTGASASCSGSALWSCVAQHPGGEASGCPSGCAQGYGCCQLADSSWACVVTAPDANVCSGDSSCPVDASEPGGCCPSGTECVGQGQCCPSGESECGQGCCPMGQCVSGSCLAPPAPPSVCTGNETDCGGICCPTGTTCTGGIACIAAAPTQTICHNSIPCGAVCCPTGLACLAPGVCGQSPAPAACPPNVPDSCGNGQCCAAGFTCTSGVLGQQVICQGSATAPSGSPTGPACGINASCEANEVCSGTHCCPQDHPVSCGQSCCLPNAPCNNDSCGCPEGEADCGGQCCSANAVCSAGVCQAVCADPAYPTACGDACCAGNCSEGACACPDNHPLSCGDVCCLAQGTCANGQCSCPPTQALCGDVCCSGGQECNNGSCVDQMVSSGCSFNGSYSGSATVTASNCSFGPGSNTTTNSFTLVVTNGQVTGQVQAPASSITGGAVSSTGAITIDFSASACDGTFTGALSCGSGNVVSGGGNLTGTGACTCSELGR